MGHPSAVDQVAGAHPCRTQFHQPCSPYFAFSRNVSHTTAEAAVMPKPMQSHWPAPAVYRMTNRMKAASSRLQTGTDIVPSAQTYRVILEGLFTTVTNVNFNTETTQVMIDKVHAESASLSDSPADDYDMSGLWNADEDIRSLKSLILFGMRGMAAYAYHALMLGKSSDELGAFFIKGLSA